MHLRTLPRRMAALSLPVSSSTRRASAEAPLLPSGVTGALAMPPRGRTGDPTAVVSPLAACTCPPGGQMHRLLEPSTDAMHMPM